MKKNTIRTLSPGEPIPAGEPKRWKKGNGYVELRWRLGVDQFVRSYEHRVIDGRVTTAPQVHHINGRKDDNRPENLEHVTTVEHGLRHRDPLAEVFRAEYEAGAGLRNIAQRHGRNTGTVCRMLMDLGVTMRTKNDYARRVDPAELRRLHADGVRLNDMCRHFNEARGVVHRQLAEMGLAPNPRKGSTDAERQSRMRNLAAITRRRMAK